MSALDSHVGGAILEEVFFEHLKKKTIIMTTHRYHFLDRVDEIFLLKNGEIIVRGPYEQVKQIKEIHECVKIVTKNLEIEKEKTQRSKIKTIQREEIQENQNKDMETGQENLLKQETKRTGSVKLEVFKFYLSKGGSCLGLVVYILFIFSTFFCVLSDYWAGSWVSSSFPALPERHTDW